MDMKVRLPVIPSGARNLLFLFFTAKKQIPRRSPGDLLGLTGRRGDFRQSRSDEESAFGIREKADASLRSA
jgi:hypothetical protein